MAPIAQLVDHPTLLQPSTVSLFFIHLFLYIIHGILYLCSFLSVVTKQKNPPSFLTTAFSSAVLLFVIAMILVRPFFFLNEMKFFLSKQTTAIFFRMIDLHGCAKDMVAQKTVHSNGPLENLDASEMSHASLGFARSTCEQTVSVEPNENM